jgi:hypothetical protein
VPLEKADLTTVSKYVRDTVNRLPPRAMKAVGIGRVLGAPEADTPPVGDSSDRLATTSFVQAALSLTPKITTSAISGGPPASPSNGDIWVAVVNTSGVRWTFQYNAGSASAYKWEFLGGSALHVEDGTAHTTASTTPVDFNPTILSLTPPRSGDYVVSMGARIKVSATGWGSLRFYNFTDAPTTAIGAVVQSDDTGQVGPSVSTRFASTLIGGKEYRARYDSTAGITVSVDFGYFELLPVRVS